MSRCTGACCLKIHLYQDGSPVPHVWLRQWIEIYQDTEVAKMWAVLRRPANADTGRALEYTCAALTSSGCCLSRDERPKMCSTFPDGQLCYNCGARSDQEARGVALMRSV